MLRKEEYFLIHSQRDHADEEEDTEKNHPAQNKQNTQTKEQNERQKKRSTKKKRERLTITEGIKSRRRREATILLT